MTLADGRVLFLKGFFDIVLEKNNPGVLARVLYHEAHHFDRLPGGWGNIDKEERDAYARDVKMAKVFGLKQEDIDDLISNRDEYANAVKTGIPLTNTSLTPLQEATWKNHYEQLQVNLEEEFEALTLEAAAKREALKRRQEEERAAREKAENERMQREEERKRESKARVLNEYRAAASNCGLTPIMTKGNLTLGFKAGQSANVYFTEPVTLEQAKASMLMTRACWVGTGGTPEDSPCTDALGAMKSNWANAGFRHGLELDADSGDIDSCLRAIREDNDPPQDMRALNKRVSRSMRDWRDANKRRELNRLNEDARAREESGRRSRGDAEERSGYVPDHNYDLTPARRAIENGRRSHFE